MKKVKYIRLDWQVISDSSADDPGYCIRLNQGEVMALASMLEYMRWRTRWINLSDNDDLQSFVDELEYKLMGCGCFDCDSVALCIEDSESVKQSLERWIAQSEYDKNLKQSIETLRGIGGGAGGGGGSCNDALLFGQITSLFDELYSSGLDWLEILDDSFQFTELIAELSEQIGAAAIAAGVKATIAAQIVIIIAELTEQYIQDLFQAYQAAYTTELRDDLRCEFFCIVRDRCEFTIEDVLDWLSSELSFSASSLNSLFNWFIGGGFNGRASVLSVWYLELALYQFAIHNRLINIIAGKPATDSMLRLSRVIAAADEDGDYSIFCDCAESWEHTFDFTASTAGWRAFFDGGQLRAEYVPDQGFRRRLAFVGGRLQIETVNAVSTVITSFSVTFNRQDYVLPTSSAIVYTNLGAQYSGVIPLLDFTQTGNVSIENGRVYLFMFTVQGTFTPAFPDDLYVTSITLTGTGVNPFA